MDSSGRRENDGAKISKLIEFCENEVREGRLATATKALASVNLSSVARELRLPMANLCRRLRMHFQGLRLLTPVVYQTKRKWAEEASPEELTEYAILLERAGGIREALRIAEKIDSTKVPQALFCRISCLVSQWDYLAAIPLLKQYAGLCQTPYARLIAEVNLAAALIADGHLQAAGEILPNILEQTKTSSSIRLHANCLELRAQLGMGNLISLAAKTDLEEAARLLKGSSTLDSIFIEKWKAVIRARELKSTAPLLRFRGRAQALKQWETVRETDLLILKIRFEQERFNQLLFGTPYHQFRLRVQRELGTTALESVYRIGPAKASGLNLISGRLSGIKASSVPEGKIHELLRALFSDFYRPFPVVALFSNLFANEYFNITSSPFRVRQIIFRARAWLNSEEIPITILSRQGQYQAQCESRFSVLVSLDNRAPKRQDKRLTVLKAAFMDRDFSAREARSRLKMPLTTFNRFISWALENRQLEKFGQGPATRYRILEFSPSEHSSAA